MTRLAAFGANAYLTLAAEALERERRPLTPAEMLEIARQDGFLPSHLFGATMHKTLAARLAENVRTEGAKSQFYRTAPSTFFLHDIAADPAIPKDYKKVSIGHLRSKSIRKENVLVAPSDILSDRINGDFIEFDEEKFDNLFVEICRFMDRSFAEDDASVKQFVTFTLVTHQKKILIHRRGKFTTTSKRLQGQLSVGFGGHVNDQDFDLFNKGQDAFRSNAARELREELFLDDIYRSREDTMDRARVLGYINVDDSPDAQHHIAVLIAFHHISPELPKKGELSINQLSWLDLDTPLNDTSDFDHWSGIILRNLYQGKIKLDQK